VLLQGLKVVEFASYIAGPGAACILGDWGADVIKVERPGGDTMRHAFADVGADIGNPTFDLDNRGKRAIVLDISKPEGREALTRLALEADVFLTNVRPASLRKHGLDDKTLRAANPRLVYAVVTGYGLEGPDAHLPGFDVTAFWARAGVASMTTPKGQEPFLLRSGFGDHITSLSTVSGILAALYEREKTGEGRLVATSLVASGIYTMGSDLAIQLKIGRVASARPRNAGSSTTRAAPAAAGPSSARRRGGRSWPPIRASRPAACAARTPPNAAPSWRPPSPSCPSTRSRAASTPPTWSGRRCRPRPTWPPTRRWTPPACS